MNISLQKVVKLLFFCIILTFFTQSCSSPAENRATKYDAPAFPGSRGVPSYQGGRAAPDYYYRQAPSYPAPNPYYYQQNPYGGAPQGGSRFYSNPYAFTPPAQYPYYEQDRYYVPPTNYNNIERQQPYVNVPQYGNESVESYSGGESSSGGGAEKY